MASRCGIASTKREYLSNASKPGYTRMSIGELSRRVGALGYKLKKEFNYANRHNPPACWDAASYSVEDKRTGRSFAHVDQRNPNLKKLQELRKSAWVFHRGRIVEF